MEKGYIICATPRTGSTLLCGLLTAIGAGNPDSYFAPKFIPEWAAEWNLPPRDIADEDFAGRYLAAAIAAGTAGTGLFGLRLMLENLDDLAHLIDRVHPGLDSHKRRHERAFGPVAYIHLSRAESSLRRYR